MLFLASLVGAASTGTGEIADDLLAREARSALEKAAEFFRSISTNGGYLWRYSEDLKERAGEQRAGETQIWVQPPGTPSVGMAFLRAYLATKDRRYLSAALAAAEALIWGQLESGGWAYQIDFDPVRSQAWYRRAERGKLSIAEVAKRRNTTTFDDNTTQSVLRFLMAVADVDWGSNDDKANRVREALEYGLQGILRAQYPNGAWPQTYDGAPRDPRNHPAQRARIPGDWPRTFPNQRYQTAYTLNDNTMRDLILTLLEANSRYHKPEYLKSAEKGGRFLILAQLPEPQAIWAQQYNFQMEPIWARRFEPPAVCSNESAGVIRTLVDLYLATGDEEYLKPIPAAISWSNRSQIALGIWARFYELTTNKPLYFTRDYRLVYTDNDLPTHYSFKGEYGVSAAIAYYEQVKRLGRNAYLARQKSGPLSPQQREVRRKQLGPRVRAIIAALDANGRWVNNGWIESGTFIRNVETLCDYLEAAQ